MQAHPSERHGLRERPAAVDTAAVRVVVRHEGIAGRTRISVSGLRRNPALGERIATWLERSPGVEAVQVSALSGSILVFHHPTLEAGAVAALVGDGLRRSLGRSRPGSGPTTVAPTAPRPTAPPSTSPAPTSPAPTSPAPTPGAQAEGAGEQRDSRPDWHRLSAADALARTGSRRQGLAAADAERRLAAEGPNASAALTPRSAIAMLLDQFRGPPVLLLMAAAGLSVATGGLADAGLIAGVIAINAGIGFATERRTDRTIRTLSLALRPQAIVVRDGVAMPGPAEDVVRGDILVLAGGEAVAADARLIDADHLTVDESVLTGESLPVGKSTDALTDPHLPLADRANMAWRGTVVAGGSGRAVVVATGPRTEFARVQRLTGEVRAPETPMQRQLSQLGNQLVLASGLACLAFLGIGLLRGWGGLSVLRGAISLAVAAVPEGLPTVATTVMALGVRRMRQENVLVRRLDAVETLGAVRTICFDKTGTLTRNHMAVVSLRGVTESCDVVEGRLVNGGERNPIDVADVRRLLRVGVLCNDADVDGVGADGSPRLSGSPTEAALLALALDAGLDVAALRRRWPRVSVRLRSDRRRFMVTVHRHRDDGRMLVAIKGSPAEVLACCRFCLANGEEVPLDDAVRAAIARENAAMGDEGLRVLGFASRPMAPQGDGENDDGPGVVSDDTPSVVSDDTPGVMSDDTPAVDESLVWLGLVGMADPPREGMRALVRSLHEAGIGTVMITGDQSATARAVARRLGLGGQGREIALVDAPTLDRAEPAAFADLAGQADVFARVTPAHKLRIVRALQAGGRVVAMTGDGVNDSPALKAADIGVAMGHGGSDVARDAADVVLGDDDLRTMLTAVRLGRTIHANVRKAIRYLVATNLSEIELMLLAAVTGLGQPLSPMQLLWINLASDVFPGLALAMEPPEPDVLKGGPRPADVPILAGSDLRRLVADGTVLAGGSLAAYLVGIARHGPGRPGQPGPAGTMAFLSLVTAQLLYAASCRSDHPLWSDSRRRLPPNPALSQALIGSFAAQGLVTLLPPLRRLLGIGPLSPFDAVVTAAAALLPLLVIEARKGADGEP